MIGFFQLQEEKEMAENLCGSNPMFCFQCEQTAHGTGCTTAGVCGKTSSQAALQDKLTGELVALARIEDGQATESTWKVILEGLFTTVTNVSFSDEAIELQIQKTIDEIEKLHPECAGMVDSCPDHAPLDMCTLWEGNDDIRSLKSLLLLGLRGMGAYAYHAYVLGLTDDTVNQFMLKALKALAADLPAEELLALDMELGQVNLACMALLDKANTTTYGTPVPTKVSTFIEPGPFIVISGHDLKDLELLLKQTEGKGVQIYTHGEMLPAHAYPKLKAYSHLKGNFGTAWQSQQKEFANVPGAFLFTTNCLMPVKDSYRDRVFTTEVVSYPGLIHIGEDKDFTPVIEKALELGGYTETKELTGINGGHTLTTGFGWGTVLSVADKVVDAVKAGQISHFFLVGGCDGARPGRNYYTEFVKQTPKDSIILTLACGKYRFNDLDLGDIGGLPRIMDMGQCNDAYSAIQVAIALAGAFNCGVNELPLTMVLSWYEQKAVVILLTLLSLGIKNIYLGPTLPAFVSPFVLDYLVKNFGLTPTSTPEQDLAAILGK